MWCLSVCSSVMFVNSVKISNHILRLFSPPGSQTILVFVYQTLWQYSEATALWRYTNLIIIIIIINMDVKCMWGRKKLPFLTTSWLSDRRLVECEQQVWPSIVQFTAQTTTQQWIFVYHDQHGSMDEQDEEKRTRQNLLICSGKSATKVTNKFCIQRISDNYDICVSKLFTRETMNGRQ